MTIFSRLMLLVLILLSAGQSAEAYDRLPTGVWFLRVTNPADALSKLCLRVYFNPNRDPWNGNVFYVAQGGFKSDAPKSDTWLAPGQSSDWVDIGPYMSSSPTFGTADQYLSPVILGTMCEPSGPQLRLTVDLATGPDKRIVRTIDANDPHPTVTGASTWLGGTPLPTLALLVPIHPDNGQRIWTAEEAAQQQLDWITAYGPTPTVSARMHVISHQWQVAFQNPTRLQTLNTEIVRRLGYNLTQFVSDARDIETIRAMGLTPIPGLFVSRDNAEEAARAMKEKGTWEWVRFANFGDEVDIQLKAKPEEQDAAFVAYLREHGFKALDFVRPAEEAKASGLSESDQWQLVHLGGPLQPEKPKLLFEAATFRYKLWTRELAADTSAIRKYFPEGTETGSNYSPHLSVWPDVRKWIDVFRDGGMTMPWSEDWWWQTPEATPQSYGFLMDALRRAADYNNAPYCFYTIPDPGETDTHLLRMNYYALGHQAKVIDHFAIYNQILGTCDYVDFVESENKFKAIHRIMSDVGKIDALLYHARMRPAEAGIVLSIANDVWNTEDLLTKDPPTENLYYAAQNVDNHERKALWLALRHAQFPVDLLTDEDIATGIPKRFKVLYLVGQEMKSEAVPHLRQWVESGGTLVAVGGGGILDQYRAVQSPMLDLYGLQDAKLERPVRSLSPSADLPVAKPLDTITFNASYGSATLPVYCALQRLTPGPGTTVAGHFADGAPAAIERPLGQGRILLIGALPGLAYLQPSQIDRKGMPENFPEPIRKLITGPAENAHVQRHVTVSEPLVEATLQESDQGTIITLINFRNAPIAEIRLTLTGLPCTRSVTSLRQGPLGITQTPDGPQVTLALDCGDFLQIE